MTEQLLVSKGNQKIELPNKKLVGVEPTKKPEKDLTSETENLNPIKQQTESGYRLPRPSR